MLTGTLSFEHQIARDAAAVTVNVIDLRAAFEALGEAIERAISQFLRFEAATPLEELNEPDAEGLIFCCGALKIGRE
jgi:hypothetical protein